MKLNHKVLEKRSTFFGRCHLNQLARFALSQSVFSNDPQMVRSRWLKILNVC